MNLLPFPLYLKFQHQPDAPEVRQHDSALVSACAPVAEAALAHTNPNNSNHELLKSEYMAILRAIIRHAPDPDAASRAMLAGVREIKAGDFYSAPVPFEAALAAGMQYFVPGGHYVSMVIPQRLDTRTTIEEASKVVAALDAAISQGAEYLGWLQNGTPQRQVDFRDPDQDPTHHCSKGLWHRHVYPKIGIQDLSFLNQGKEVDASDFEAVEALKTHYVDAFLRYTRDAHRMLSDRISRLNRYWEGRRR